MSKKRFNERVLAGLLEHYCQTQNWLLSHRCLAGQKNYKKFVVVCNIRTGSTMLGSMLASHPQTVCFFELFHRHLESIPFGVPGYRKKSTSSRVVNLRNNDPVEFLKSEVYGFHKVGIKAVGFKLLYPQARRGSPWWNSSDFDRWWKKVGYEPNWDGAKSDLWEYLRNDRSIAIIHLKRENLLRSKVSAITAQSTGEWGVGATGGFSGVATRPKFALDFNECLQDFEAHRRMENETDQLFSKHKKLDLTYEQLISNPVDVGREIQAFLSLDIKPLKAKTKKQASRELFEVVSNYEQLKKKFSSTSWHYLFND